MKLINALRLAFTTIKNYIDTTLPLKLDIHQGAENSGKIMGVNEEGNLVPVENEIDLSTYETKHDAQFKYVELNELIDEAKDYTNTEIDEFSNQVAFINEEDNEDVINPDIIVSDLVIDSELSPTSTNPVQNKTVNAKFEELEQKVENAGGVSSWNDLIDKPFDCVTTLETSVFFEGEVTDGYMRDLPDLFSINNKDVNVTLDGVEYKTKCNFAGGTSSIVFGGYEIEKFVTDSYASFSPYDGNHSIKIEAISEVEEITPLDEKYMPDSIPKIENANIGDTVCVKEVDENGKPMKWERVNLPKYRELRIVFYNYGDGNEYECVFHGENHDYTIDEEVTDDGIKLTVKLDNSGYYYVTEYGQKCHFSIRDYPNRIHEYIDNYYVDEKASAIVFKSQYLETPIEVFISKS